MRSWSRALVVTWLASAAGCGGAGARGAPPRADPGSGRLAGSRVLHMGGQSTLWFLYCPTESSSPLRGACSYVRADDPAAGRQRDGGEAETRDARRSR